MIFIDACLKKETPYTPIWMMRQAGRYLLQILGAKIDKYQFNIQSAVGSVGLFFNAAKNFGLSIEARGGIPFYFIQSKFSKAFGTPRLNIYSIGITFTFYDFTRFLG
ncbi:hypothetical protein VN0271_12860 [Helicobacter pylori]|nr:hypothetical protein VN0271_12860 [Helicobacter pylori]